MEQQTQDSTNFFERRRGDTGPSPGNGERRQFRDGNRSARPEVAELANAIDDYKLAHRRRFITFEELFDVMVSLGYHRELSSADSAEREAAVCQG
ncbi:MAG: hypothetical protein JNL58_22795 [Planctomyces sp.]|nr:hypothetical protein [Planctomyces sp.]